MNTLTLEEKRSEAAKLRNDAKVLFGESLKRADYLNPAFPMARFVDMLIDATIAELEIRLATEGKGLF